MAALLKNVSHDAHTRFLAGTRQKRPYPLEKLVVRQSLKVLVVHPLQLRDIEDGSTGAEARPRELLDHVLVREDLAFIGHAPAHQSEIVKQRLGQKALFDEPQQ